MLERVWQKRNPLALLVGMQIDIVTNKNIMEISLKTWNKTTVCVCVGGWVRTCVSACISSLVAQSCPTLCNPMDFSPPSSYVHGIFFPDKNTGVGNYFLLQVISPTQESNPGLLHWEDPVGTQNGCSVTIQRGGRGRKVSGKFKREGICVCLWLIHVDVWQKPSQNIIIFQLKTK